MTVAAIVLAAGRGRRMGGAKHLLPMDGEPMLLRVVAALEASAAEDLVVVLAPADEAGAELLRARGTAFTRAESAGEGRAASVRAGVRATPEDRDLLFALADQPYLLAADYDCLIAAAAPGGIAHASYAGVRGSPVLFGRRHRAELLELSGAEGGRVLIERHAGSVRPVALDPERGRDLDRPSDLR